MSTEFVTGVSTAVGSLATDLQDLVTGNLTNIFTLFAITAGIIYLMKLVRRAIGR